jgi:hypothetical protein
MTLTETTGKVVTSIADQFKTQPLCLALLIMNGALLFFIYNEQNTFSQRAREVQDWLRTVVERCTPARTSALNETLDQPRQSAQLQSRTQSPPTPETTGACRYRVSQDTPARKQTPAGSIQYFA